MQTIDTGNPDDNIIQPFRLESSALRGRIVKLGSTLDEILEPHNYPKPVAHLVAETVTLSLLLSAMLKYEGIFTLQTKGDGPISMLVSDITSKGAVRACAHFDAERTNHARESLEAMKSPESSQNHLAQYLGKGNIAFTVDQDQAHIDRYQGIVELKGASMVDCVQHYFNQSEQIGTGIKMAVGQRDDKWRAGGIMLQHMPEEGGIQDTSNLGEDDWVRSMILLDSCTEDEFLAPDLHHCELLLRLFHEEGVRIFDPKKVYKSCRCSKDKVENILVMMPEDDLDYMTVDGKIVMHCEFCGHDYRYEKKDVRNLKVRKKELVDARD